MKGIRDASLLWILVGVFGLFGCSTGGVDPENTVRLLNVSYDPTRSFYQEFNELFAKHWMDSRGQVVVIDQSHAGSGKQARSVIDGLEADVVTLALGYDIDAIAKHAELLPKDWQTKLPNNSSPYTSAIVFLVRKGNPKGIRDWPDLVREDVSVITANPKTSGGARWNYMSAWTFVLDRELGDLSKLKSIPHEQLQAADLAAEQFVRDLYRRVPVLDSGARGATNTFIQRGLGDVLITWENEAMMALQESPDDSVVIVTPSISLLAEPTVAVIEQLAIKHNTLEVADSYLEYLYSLEAQKLAAKHFFRPTNRDGIPSELTDVFSELKLVRLADVFGSWVEVQKRHFDDGGLFDQMYNSQ